MKICLLGPVGIAGGGDPNLMAALLDGGDGRFVLAGDQPVSLQQAWCDTLGPLLAGSDPVLLVYPSWWTAPRIEVVRRAAKAVAGQVELRSRSGVLLRQHPAAVIVEIACHVVLVAGGGGAVSVHRRDGPPQELAREVADTVRGRTVIVDAPLQVAGAEVLATSIARLLTARGVAVTTDGERRLSSAEETPDTPVATGRGSRVRHALLAAAFAATVLAATTLVAQAGDRADPPPATVLVEGRVTMDVPAGWTVQRVTHGPGSARVQAVSPDDADAALHLTQSRLADPGLPATAAALRHAIDTEPAGTFVDFDPAGQRAGRPAVTYREVRSGREIGWTVLVDGDVRISIGCQYGAGREESVMTACDAAVRTARRLR